MADIWFTSDLHFGHDREFVWKVRGYKDVEDMNKQQIEKFNSVVKPEDTVYILGDTMLGDNVTGEECLAKLNGHKIMILGNHDTAKRIEIYKKYVDEMVYATVIKYKKKVIYLSHYPTLTASYDDALCSAVLNFHGHTHQTTNFLTGQPHYYHVGVDSHDGYPVNIDDILAEIKTQAEGYFNFSKKEVVD